MATRQGQEIITKVKVLSKQSSADGKSPKVSTIQQNTDISWAQQKHWKLLGLFFFSNHLLLCNGLELTLGKWKINQMHLLSFHQSSPLANQVWVFLDPFPLASCIFRQWIHASNISMNAKLRITVIFWNTIKDFLWFPLSLTSLEYWKTTKLKSWYGADSNESPFPSLSNFKN